MYLMSNTLVTAPEKMDIKGGINEVTKKVTRSKSSKIMLLEEINKHSFPESLYNYLQITSHEC